VNRQQLLETAKPILFNTEMVRAILDGRKTVTMGVIKEQLIEEKSTLRGIEEYKQLMLLRAKYQKGDILYVRETFANTWTPDSNDIGYIYKADGKPSSFPYWGNEKQCKDEVWIPSMHMPKEAARIFLKVTDVRVERFNQYEKNLQADFIKHWNSKIKKSDFNRYRRLPNLYVWVYEFERII
jgi:hypothetical protein